MIQDLHRILPPLQSLLVTNGPSHDGAKHGIEVLVAADDVQFTSLMLSQLDGEYRVETVVGLDRMGTAVEEMRPAALVVGVMHHENVLPTLSGLLMRGSRPRGLPVSVMLRGRGEVHNCLEICGDLTHPDVGTKLASAVVAQLGIATGRRVERLLIADGAESLRTDGGVALRAQGIRAVALGAGALVLDSLRYGDFDAMVLGPTLMDMTAGELLNRLIGAELPADLPMAIFGAAGEAEWLSFEIAVLKRRNGFVEARDETDSFLRRALQVKGKTI